MKIEVGEYVKTNSGNFAKVILVCSEDYYAGEVIRATYKCDNEKKYDYKNINSEFYKGINQYLLKEEMIIKHSKNILDLIEVGDILKIKEDNDIYYIGLEKDTITVNYKDIKEDIKNNRCELLAILTKEQYNQNCYRLEK